MENLEGKVFVIAGVTGGLFRELVSILTARGADVVPLSRDQAGSGSIFEEIRVGHGEIDGMIHIVGSLCGSRTLEEIETEEWDEVVGRNLRNVFLWTKGAGRIMGEAGRGTILNVSLHPGRWLSPFGGPHNGLLKSGVVEFSRKSKAGLASRGVRLSAAGLSLVSGTQGAGPVWEYYSEEELNAFVDDVPVGRIVNESEAAEAILDSIGAIRKKAGGVLPRLFNQFGWGI
ncbi:MAG TPA: SDR family NAD(P)-dependent oxidoreductase [Candidatus Deferrimicrobiaceae bacterium]